MATEKNTPNYHWKLQAREPKKKIQITVVPRYPDSSNRSKFNIRRSKIWIHIKLPDIHSMFGKCPDIKTVRISSVWILKQSGQVNRHFPCFEIRNSGNRGAAVLGRVRMPKANNIFLLLLFAKTWSFVAFTFSCLCLSVYEAKIKIYKNVVHFSVQAFHSRRMGTS